MKKIIILSLLAGLGSAVLAENAGHQFLKIPASARPSAMGEAYIAASGDPCVLGYNPAGLAGLEQASLSLTHVEWLSDLGFEYANFALPFGKFLTAGLEVRLLHSAAFKSVDALGAEGAAISAGDLGIIAGAGIRLSAWRFGASLKWVRNTLADYDLQSLLLDVGAERSFSLGSVGWDVGLVGRNLGFNVKKIGSQSTPLPAEAGLGNILHLLKMVNHRLDLNLDAVGLLTGGFAPLVNAGAEYTLFRIVSIRAGYRYGASGAGFSGGIGVRYKFADLVLFQSVSVKGLDVSADYAILPYSGLDINHFVSLTLRFPSAVSSVTKPERQAPEKQKKVKKSLEEEESSDIDSSREKDQDVKTGTAREPDALKTPKAPAKPKSMEEEEE